MTSDAISSEVMWRLFTSTGNVIFYLLYKELQAEETSEKTA